MNELGKDRLNQNLLLRCSERHNNIVVDIQTQGVEAKEKSDPAQVADDRFFVLEHPGQDIVFIGFGVVVTDEEDRSVGECTTHQEDGDVLMVGVQSSLRRIRLCNKGI